MRHIQKYQNKCFLGAEIRPNLVFCLIGRTILGIIDIVIQSKRCTWLDDHLPSDSSKSCSVFFQTLGIPQRLLIWLFWEKRLKHSSWSRCDLFFTSVLARKRFFFYNHVQCNNLLSIWVKGFCIQGFSFSSSRSQSFDLLCWTNVI